MCVNICLRQGDYVFEYLVCIYRYLWDGEPYRVFPPGLKVSYSVEKEVEVVEKRQKSPDLSSASATTTSSNSTPHASTVISTTTSKSTEQNTIEETNKV